jgi:endonuclease-3
LSHLGEKVWWSGARSLGGSTHPSGCRAKDSKCAFGNAFGQATITVDTHVARVSQRLRLTHHTDPEEIEGDLVEIVPRKEQVEFSHLLQFHGRRICIARNPDCPYLFDKRPLFYPKKTKSNRRIN